MVYINTTAFVLRTFDLEFMIFEKFPKVSVSVGSFEPKFEVLKQNEKTVKIKEKRKRKKEKKKRG